MDTYPLIQDHGLIGDLQTAALVSTDGAVDWFCAPRFDSPSIFAALLDRRKGGYFQVVPTNTEYTSKQLYLPGTAILITRFLSADGVGELVDFMPIAGDQETNRHRLVRLLRVVRGTMHFRITCKPAFDYARGDHETQLTDEGAVFRSDHQDVTLHISRPEGGRSRDVPVRQVDGGVEATAVLSAGYIGGVVLETGSAGPARVVAPAEIEDLFIRTRDFWRDWIGRSRYAGRWREMVERSAMTLKLMTYAPSGALVAAPTTGLPEQVGGERNWDYRFTWIRDASFSVYSMLGLGYTDEARAFGGWLSGVVARAREQSAPLQIMYRIDGTPDLREENLDHLEGYRGSHPVRIGNDAAGQLQLDIYGEAMDSIHLADTHGIPITTEGWANVEHIMGWLSENWNQPDDGIWETRGGRRDFTYGRLMSWVAFDRAVRIAQRRGRPADIAGWSSTRDEIFRQIMERGFHTKREAFVQHYDTDVLDASMLYMPLVGFIPGNDQLWQSTLHAMDDEIVSDSLVYRYDPEASPDGLRGSEGTFTICSFWYVDALARSGRLDDALLTFEKMLTYGNHLGLYSEEIAPTGEQIGNFPQAFSHLALINAAMNLDHRIDHVTGDVLPTAVAAAS